MATYIIKPKASGKISNFYRNVAKKYSNLYSWEQMKKNIEETINGMYLIENGLLRRKPTIPRWQKDGCFMAKYRKWYYLYCISEDGNTIIIIDACHTQNMHEAANFSNIILIKESQLRRIIREAIRKIIA